MRQKTFVLVFTLILAATAVSAVSVPFRSNFNLDTAGLPPGLGGSYQPTLMVTPAGASITVVTDSLGLSTQPVELYSNDGSYAHLRWNLLPVVSELGVEVSFRVSLGQLYTGHIFQLSVQNGTIPARLRASDTGLVRLTNGCGGEVEVGSYSPGVPINVIVRFAPPDALWLIVDGENDGFENNVPFEATSCNPGNLAHLWVFAGGGTDPVTVALDDLEVGWLPLFVDGFESGDAGLWSTVVP